jgi:hypothetical protein
MNRRTAIYSITGLFAAAFISASSWKLWSIYKKPDLSFLVIKKNLIAEIAETIIPATDSPGAKMANVEDFIILMVMDCLDIKSQNNFIKGLNDFEAHTYTTFRKSYIDCTIKERELILNHFEDASNSNGLVQKVKSRILGESFFPLFKRLTVVGFCTSRPGATEALGYIFIPSNFQACIQVTQNQKSWATK